MNPTAGNLEILPFISEFVIDLITVSDEDTGIVFQELLRMIRFPGILEIVDDDRVGFVIVLT